MFDKLREAIQQKLTGAPIECPRGWGQVAFHASGFVLLPMVWLGRTCPISGVESCAACGYASNPDGMQLARTLAALEELRRAGSLSEDEYSVRRTAALVLHPPKDPARGFRIAAWILGPLGVLGAVVTWFLVPRETTVFWIAGGASALLLTLTLSFAVLGRGRSEVVDGALR